MRLRTIHLGTLAIVASIAPWSATASAESMAPVDCTTASTQLTAMKMPQIAATGNVDHDYLMMADADSKLAMKMAHLEMACGKSDAARKAARATMAREEAISAEITRAVRVPI